MKLVLILLLFISTQVFTQSTVIWVKKQGYPFLIRSNLGERILYYCYGVVHLNINERQEEILCRGSNDGNCPDEDTCYHSRAQNGELP